MSRKNVSLCTPLEAMRAVGEEKVSAVAKDTEFNLHEGVKEISDII